MQKVNSMRTVVVSLASACWLVASLSLVHCGGDSTSGDSGSAGSGTSSGTGNTGSNTGSTGSGTGSTGSGTGSTGSGTGASGTGTGSGTGSTGSATGTGSTGSTGTTAGTTGSSGSSTTGTTGASGTTGSSGSSGSGSKDAGAGDASKGSVDSGGGSGGGDGSVSPANFQPCPTDGGACKILPLGDSITYGIDSVVGTTTTQGGGYRVELFHDALMNKKNITFVGSLTDGAQMVDGVAFPTANEGHSGWTVEQIQGITPMDLMPNPNIILLLIGTNNMYGADNSTPTGGATDLPKLVDAILMNAPDALLAVSTITPLTLYQNGMYETDVTTYNATIQPMVATRAAAGKHIIFVDLFTGFDSTTMLNMSDKIHPNNTGYSEMGDKWYAAISPYLP